MYDRSLSCRGLSISLFIFLILFSIFYASQSVAATLTTVTVKEMDGVSTSNYPLTFGMVFKQGDVTGNVFLNSYPTQTDVKTTWDDGSIRHAVVSALVPVTANTDLVLNINDTGTPALSTPMNKTEILATDIGATIDINNLSGSGYSGSLQANLRAAITAESTLDYWLEGDVVSEILVTDDLNNSLNATWEVRFYEGTSYIRVSHAIENVNLSYIGNVSYDYSISQGNTSPLVVKATDSIEHLHNSRWRKVYWLGSEPPEVEVHYDLDYLIATGMVPSYDTSLTLDSGAISSWVSNWDSYPTEPYDTRGSGTVYSGFARVYLPATGGRSEIGLLPQWQAMYLLSWDAGLKRAMLGQAELFANVPIHYREDDAGKAFFNRIVSIDDRSNIRTHSNYYANLPSSPIGAYSNGPWTIDWSHQSSFAYLPYLVTGEKFYLDELYYWAGYNLSSFPADPGWGRDFSNGFLRTQVRGEAWTFRNIAHAAVMSPEGDPEGPYFESKMINNIDQWAIDISVFPLRTWENNSGITEGLTGTTGGTSGWMDDFMSIVLNHVNDLGFDTTPVLDMQNTFQIGRFTNNPAFNPFNGDAYRFPVSTSGGYISTWADAQAHYSSYSQTSFEPDGIAYGYDMIAMAALSQLTNYPGGSEAYSFLKTNVPEQNLFTSDPTWALVPRNRLAPAENLRID